MRYATLLSVAVIGLSTAALAQVASPYGQNSTGNTLSNQTVNPDDAAANGMTNEMSNSTDTMTDPMTKHGKRPRGAATPRPGDTGTPPSGSDSGSSTGGTGSTPPRG